MAILARSFTYYVGIFFMLFIALNLSSCAPTQTYPGTARPPENVAVIEASLNFFSSASVHIQSFDGNSTQTDKVEALPGEHEIVLFLSDTIGGYIPVRGDPETLTINVEPGHKYWIKGKWNDGKNKVWIEDAKSGVVIAHNKHVTSTVSEAEESEPINMISMTCTKPYQLEQDCSIWSGATRSIVIDGFKVNVAGSKDGKVVLVMDAKLFSKIWSKKQSQASNNSFHAIKKALDEEKIEIIRVRPIKSFGDIYGYVLELAEDGYSILKKFSSNPKDKK